MLLELTVLATRLWLGLCHPFSQCNPVWFHVYWSLNRSYTLDLHRRTTLNQQITLHVSGHVLNSNASKKGIILSKIYIFFSTKNKLWEMKEHSLSKSMWILMFPHTRMQRMVAEWTCFSLQPLSFVSFLTSLRMEGKLAMPSDQFFVSVIGMLTDVTFIHGDWH